jgi:hypothetical protein
MAGLLLQTRDTVEVDTPASAATSLIVTAIVRLLNFTSETILIQPEVEVNSFACFWKQKCSKLFEWVMLHKNSKIVLCIKEKKKIEGVKF